MTKTLITTAIAILLGGCSSKPSEITWYHLNGLIPKQATPNDVIGKNRQYIQLVKISVPDYLKQSKLVMRTAPYEMQFSTSNLWVQPPEKDIPAALLSELNALSQEYYFDYHPAKAPSAQLFIDVLHFYPTENSEVIFSGQWGLLHQAASHRQNHSFQFTLDLTKDGYRHAVSQQRELISLLARDINEKVTKL